MITNTLTLTDYLLQEEGSVTGTAGSLTHLLSTIEDASQMIADQVRVLALAHLTGKTGGVNTFGEEVQKLDLFANQGLFLYPPNKKQPAGKLRLMLEVNPFACLIEQAGGKAIGSDGKSPLTIRPETVHDRASLVMGSRENVDLFASFLKQSF
jgi:fructose-1,6-bisphosphatase